MMYLRTAWEQETDTTSFSFERSTTGVKNVFGWHHANQWWYGVAAGFWIFI